LATAAMLFSSVALGLPAVEIITHGDMSPGRGDRARDGKPLPWINLQALLQPTQRSQLSAPALGVYHTTQEVFDEVDALASSCRAAFTVETMGNSSDGQWPMRVVSLGERKPHKGHVLLLFGIHGREYLSAEIGLAFMRGLCDDSSGASRVLEGTSFTILPVTNPSGRDYVRQGGHSCGDMRKNGRGVDLNRNFPISWTEGSTVTMAEDYRGTAPFSEMESKLVKKLIEEQQPTMFIDVHTGDLSMLTPWNDHEAEPPPAEKAAMLKLLEHACGGKGCTQVPWPYGTPDIGVGALTGTPAYLASGTTGDYAYKAGVRYPFIWETFRLDEKTHNDGRRRHAAGAQNMELVQWADGLHPPGMGAQPWGKGTRGPRHTPRKMSNLVASAPLQPTSAPSEFAGDDCFKFFNPVSSDMLNSFIATWKTALMRASSYLSEEMLAAAAANATNAS